MYRIIGADGKEYGPISAAQLVQWVDEGRVNAETRAVAEGSTDWKPLASFAEFSIYFKRFPAPPPLVAPRAMTSPLAIKKTNGFAVTGLALGIAAWTAGLCCYGVPLNVLGIAFSLIALSQIKAEPQLYDGKGLAVAGLILSLSSVLLTVAVFLAFGSFRALHEFGRHLHRL